MPQKNKSAIFFIDHCKVEHGYGHKVIAVETGSLSHGSVLRRMKPHNLMCESLVRLQPGPLQVILLSTDNGLCFKNGTLISIDYLPWHLEFLHFFLSTTSHAAREGRMVNITTLLGGGRVPGNPTRIVKLDDKRSVF